MKPVLIVPPIEALPYCWLFQIGLNKLGVHQQDGWCIKMQDHVLLIDSEEKCVLIEPLLEIDLDIFVKFLDDVKSLIPLYAASIDQFPKVLLLKYVFNTSVSGYWPDKALPWLIADPSAQNPIYDQLVKFAENKGMPQRARQQVRKILHNLRSRSGSC